MDNETTSNAGTQALEKLMTDTLRSAFAIPAQAGVASHHDGAGDAAIERDIALSNAVLDQTAEGIVTLGVNLRKVNDLVEERTAWFNVELGRTRAELAAWEHRATAAEASTADLSAQLTAVTTRAEMAEYREVRAQAALQVLTRRILNLFGPTSTAGQFTTEVRTHLDAKQDEAEDTAAGWGSRQMLGDADSDLQQD